MTGDLRGASTVWLLPKAGRRLVQARPLPVDDPLQRCPDITLAREALKWEPKVPLAQGLKKTIEYFDGLLRTNSQMSRVGR
jgi:UDP-glucuronate decarboxylase